MDNRHKALGAGAVLILLSGCASPVTAKPVARSASLAAAAPATTAAGSPAASPSPSRLSAGCQTGEGDDDGGYTAMSADNAGDNDPGYQVSLDNGTSSAVTVTGFSGVTFTAYGSDIWTGSNTENDPALVEPGETWTFTFDLSDSGFPQASDATLLEMTCAIGEVETETGNITPEQTGEPDGDQVTQQQDVASDQQQLASDVSSLTQASQTLDTDTSLATDVTAMKNDLASEESDYRTEQGDTCDDTESDADTVTSDSDTVLSDQDTLNDDIGSLKNGEVSDVLSYVAAVQGDLRTLSGLGASPATPSASALSAGKTALSDASSAISWATAQGNSVDSEAQQLSTTAQNYASAHGCS